MSSQTGCSAQGRPRTSIRLRSMPSFGHSVASGATILFFDDTGVMKFVAWRGLSDDGYRRAVEGHSPWTRDVGNPEPITIDDIDAAELEDFTPGYGEGGKHRRAGIHPADGKGRAHRQIHDLLRRTTRVCGKGDRGSRSPLRDSSASVLSGCAPMTSGVRPRRLRSCWWRRAAPSHQEHVGHGAGHCQPDDARRP